jgi:phosphomethylpyrimidine synthase
MKITQEVREFAARQHNNPPRNGEGDHPKDGGGAPATLADAEAGMAEMSERFREVGSELYVGARGREHD